MDISEKFWEKLYKENANKVLGICRRYVMNPGKNQESSDNLRPDTLISHSMPPNDSSDIVYAQDKQYTRKSSDLSKSESVDHSNALLTEKSTLVYPEFDYLLPETGMFSSDDKRGKYLCTLKDAFYSLLPPEPVVRVIVIPLEKPEYLVSVDKREDVFILSFILLKKWLISNQLSSADFSRYELEIGPLITKKLNILFSTAISKVQYSSSVTNTTDSINYIFISHDDMGYRSGQASAGLIGEKLKELISVAEWLCISAKQGKYQDFDKYDSIIDNLTRKFK